MIIDQYKKLNFKIQNQRIRFLTNMSSIKTTAVIVCPSNITSAQVKLSFLETLKHLGCMPDSHSIKFDINKNCWLLLITFEPKCNHVGCRRVPRDPEAMLKRDRQILENVPYTWFPKPWAWTFSKVHHRYLPVF